MDVSELEDLLSDVGQQINGLDVELQAYFSNVVDQIRRSAPYRSGDLKRSIVMTGDRHGFFITMKDYGAFQNYGVSGVNSSRFPVDTPESGQQIAGVTVADRFRFGTENYGPGPGWGAYYTGLRAQRFYNIQDILDGLERTIQNQIEI